MAERQWIALGRRVAALRERDQLVQRDLAKISGLSAGYINRIEQGYNRPTPAKMRRLAEALGVEYEDLAVLAGYIREVRGEVEFHAPAEKAGVLQRLLAYPVDLLDSMERTLRIALMRDTGPPVKRQGTSEQAEPEGDGVPGEDEAESES